MEVAILREVYCCCDHVGGRYDQECFGDVGGQLESYPHGLRGAAPVRWRPQGTPKRRGGATIITCSGLCRHLCLGAPLYERNQCGLEYFCFQKHDPGIIFRKGLCRLWRSSKKIRCRCRRRAWEMHGEVDVLALPAEVVILCKTLARRDSLSQAIFARPRASDKPYCVGLPEANRRISAESALWSSQHQSVGMTS